jgi:hypothetical protein
MAILETEGTEETRKRAGGTRGAALTASAGGPRGAAEGATRWRNGPGRKKLDLVGRACARLLSASRITNYGKRGEGFVKCSRRLQSVHSAGAAIDLLG